LIPIRYVLRAAGTLAASIILLLQFIAIAGREIVPHLADVKLSGLWQRDRFTESSLISDQPVGSFLAEIDMVRRVRTMTPPDAYFLVFHQNTFAYYAGRRFIRDVDTRLVDFYRAPDKDAALAQLRQLGIQYVYLPPWSWPTIQNSKILDILKDPAAAQLVIEHAGYRLYRLSPPTGRQEGV
jgi:hypothetical protein